MNLRDRIEKMNKLLSDLGQDSWRIYERIESYVVDFGVLCLAAVSRMSIEPASGGFPVD